VRPDPNHIPPETRRELIVLFLTGLLFWTNITALLPTIPLYIRTLGATEAQIGLVMGAFAIGLLLTRPRLGKLADLRSRVLVLRIGAIVAILSPLLYLAASSVPLLFGVRVFHGISIAAFTTAYSTLVADISPANRRGETIGYMSLVTPLAMGFGPVMGSAIATQSGFPLLFLTSTILGIFSFGLSLRVQEAPQVLANRANRARQVAGTIGTVSPASPSALKFWSLLFEPRLLIPSLTLLLVGIIFGTITTFIPLFIDALPFNLNVGLFYSAAAAASFMARPLVGRLSDVMGRGPFVCIALLCYILSMAILSLAINPPMLLCAGFIEGAGAGMLIPTTLAIVSDRSRVDERGRLFALCISGFDLGLALAGPLFGQIAGTLGYRNLFAIASGLAIVALLLFATRSSKSLGHSLRFAIGRERDVYAIEDSAL
jgi:MFS family permease